mmetsp:Transcript_13813/g.27306  ORF Transcript_13813/g.27306 Transcript_13813/m.27306 type:complete len:96 (+) Transcript_13813:547-834(+)
MVLQSRDWVGNHLVEGENAASNRERPKGKNERRGEESRREESRRGEENRDEEESAQRRGLTDVESSGEHGTGTRVWSRACTCLVIEQMGLRRISV